MRDAREQILEYRRRLFWISPPGLALASMFVCLVAVLLPPSYYEELMGEPNRVFLNPYVLLYYGGSLIALLIGYWAVNGLLILRSGSRERNRDGAYMPLLLLGVGAASFALYDALTSNTSLIELLLSLSGSQIKANFAETSGVNAINFVLMGVVWWGVWLWKIPGSRGTKLVAIGLILLVIVNGVIKVARGEVLPLLFGLWVSYAGVAAARGSEAKLRVRQIGSVLLIFGIIFILFSVLRGGWRNPAADLVAYMLSSFNRLAFVIDGDLVYRDAGKGIYAISFLGYNNVLNGLLHTRDLLDWPDFDSSWNGEFDAVWAAGLNGYAIWATAPGYMLSEIGNYVFIYWFVIGLAYGWVWASFSNQGLMGKTLYPWFAFCLFFWFGTNYVPDTRLVALLLAALIIRGYELLKRRVGTS